MTDPTEKILKAINLFIESMDIDAMKGRIRDDLSEYYLTCATDDEVQEFVNTWIKPKNERAMFVMGGRVYTVIET